MPTLRPTGFTCYSIPEGTLVYLTDELTPRNGSTYNSIPAPGETGIVFKTRRELFFNELECVGCHGANGVALFKLEKDSHPKAKYLVVGAETVINRIGRSMPVKGFSESGDGLPF